jgi:hypothetical protein
MTERQLLLLIARAAREGVRELSCPGRRVTVRGRGDGWAHVTVREPGEKPYQFAIQVSALNR